MAGLPDGVVWLHFRLPSERLSSKNGFGCSVGGSLKPHLLHQLVCGADLAPGRRRNARNLRGTGDGLEFSVKGSG